MSQTRARTQVRSLLRTAVRPASLGLLALLLAAALLFTGLGRWQLDRARERAAPSPTEREVALTSVLTPAQPFTNRADHQLVRVAGHWVPDDVVLVPRSRGGRDGYDVVAALRVLSATGSAQGSALLPVLRGWTAEPAQVPGPPRGEVTLHGRLLVSEQPEGVTSPHRLQAISSADLINVWSPPLYTGYLVATSAPAPLRAVAAPPPARHLDLQNLSYAFQWWLFAAFALVLWGKTVKDRHAADLDAADLDAADLHAAWEDEASQSPPQEVST